MDFQRIISEVEAELKNQRSLVDQDAVMEAFDGLVVIVIGDNHCWGIAETLNEALANASKPAKYTAWLAKQGTTVSEFDGSLSWDKGYAPKLIGWKGVKKPAPMVAV